MRIGLVGARNYPAAHGGLEVVVEELAAALVLLGHEVHVFSGSTSSVGEVGNGVVLHRAGAVRSKHLHTASLIILSMADIRRTDLDVVHVHGVGAAFPLSLHSSVFGAAPVVVTSHGLDWERGKWAPLARRGFRTASVSAMRKATAVSAVSPSVRDALSRILGRRVSLITNAVRLPPDVDLSVPLPKGQFSVTVCRFTPEKNVAGLIRAYDEAVSSSLGPLVVIGSGASSYSDEYENAVRSAAADRDVLLLGALSRAETVAVLRRAARFISLSLLEAQPLAVMEARACQLPLILSDIPPHREVAGSGAAFVSGSSPSLAAAARVADSATRDVDPSNAPSWEEIAREYLAWYDGALCRSA